MKNILIYSLVFSIVSLSCSNRNEKQVDIHDFKRVTGLKTRKVLPINMVCPVNMILMDSLFLFRSMSNCDTNYFHLYKYPDFKHIKSFGDPGNGPNEFFEGELTYSCKTVIQDNTIWLEDLNHKMFKKIDLTNNKVIKSIVFPREIGMPVNVYFQEDEYIIGNCISEYKGAFFLYNFITNEIKINKNVPAYPGINDGNRLMMYKNIIKIKPSCDRILVAYQFINQIDIFDFNFNKILSVKTKEKKTRVIGSDDQYSTPKGAWHFFSDVYLTNNNIFVLYNKYKMDISPEELTSQKSIILKFDWKGDLIEKIILPDYVDKFVIDKNELQIIALQLSDENPFLIYNLE